MAGALIIELHLPFDSLLVLQQCSPIDLVTPSKYDCPDYLFGFYQGRVVSHNAHSFLYWAPST
jgi:hypothetical protein